MWLADWVSPTLWRSSAPCALTGGSGSTTSSSACGAGSRRNQRCQGQGYPQIGARDHCPGRSGDGRVAACVCGAMEVWASERPRGCPNPLSGHWPASLPPPTAGSPASPWAPRRWSLAAHRGKLKVPSGSIFLRARCCRVGGGVPLGKALLRLSGRSGFCGGRSISNLGSVSPLRRRTEWWVHTRMGQEITTKDCRLEMQVLS